jgi:hypothetical protein
VRGGLDLAGASLAAGDAAAIEEAPRFERSRVIAD